MRIVHPQRAPIPMMARMPLYTTDTSCKWDTSSLVKKMSEAMTAGPLLTYSSARFVADVIVSEEIDGGSNLYESDSIKEITPGCQLKKSTHHTAMQQRLNDCKKAGMP